MPPPPAAAELPLRTSRSGLAAAWLRLPPPEKGGISAIGPRAGARAADWGEGAAGAAPGAKAGGLRGCGGGPPPP